ncbi:hypothetical protein Q8A64_16260 [Oxalobacteraceae bacterium R-40]|uniref:Uncharacterized protein n=1 Tax=Keguizhuia sedimenti TaxID=3064264 RepID=A0ABU1BSZ0_9BURK|nr:hypothetical protein [Oxalobacteraceae bacterium R-40]
MNPTNQTDPGKLISDRGPAQPGGFAEEGRKGSNDVNDQRPSGKPASKPERHSQQEVQNQPPLDPDPDDSAQP